MTLPPKLRRLGIIIPVGLIAFFIIFEASVEYVPPHSTGIKASRYGGGISDASVQGGHWYLTGPGVTIHEFPRAVQALEMTDRKPDDANPDTRYIPRVEIDTSDGSKVRIEGTVLYRIVKTELVMKRVGPGRKFAQQVEPKAVGALKKHLGQLVAEDFYHESKRVQQCAKAREEMNAELAEIGVSVEHVLVTQYYYEQGYQQQIESRKVQDQLVFTNHSMAEAAKEEAALRKIEAEGRAKAEVEQQRGEAEVTKIRAEAEMYRRKKQAEADMLVKVAEAKGTALVNTSYASAGSENLVALEMAKVLDGIQVLVVSDTKNGFNPLDVEAMSRMLGGR